MSKLDKFLIIILAGFILTALLRPLVKDVAAAAFIAFLLVILLFVFGTHIYNRKKNKSEISVSDAENALSLMGNEQLDFFFERTPPAYAPEQKDGGFIFFRNDVKHFVAPNYKFSPTSADDVARFYRAAKKNRADSVIVLGRQPSRNVLVFASSLDVRFVFLSSGKLHKYLLKQNALMPKPRKTKKPSKPSLKTVFNGIFLKDRAKYYLLSGISVAFLSFLTPYKIYYLVAGGLCLILAGVCFFRKT